MGCIALIRQSFLDAAWYRAAQDGYRKSPDKTERPEANAALAALSEHVSRKQATVFETEDELELLRALRIADEFKLKPILLGNGYEYRVRKSLGKTPVILPLDFPESPDIEKPGRALEYSLDELQHWDRAPSNAARLAEAGIPIAFTTEKLEKPEKEFWSRIRLVVRRGLNKEAALAALTTAPAEIFGLNDRLGSIAPGRIANLTVASGDLFSDETARVLTTWVDGRYYETDLSDSRDPRGSWDLTVGDKTLPLVVEGELDKLTAKIGEQDAAFSIEKDGVGLVVAAKVFEKGDGAALFSGRLAGEKMAGLWSFPSGGKGQWSASRTKAFAKKPDDKPSPRDTALDFPETYPAGMFGRTALPEPAANLLIRGATIWTSGPQGTLENADLLVSNGKIVSVGPGLKAPGGAPVVEGKGLHVTPGIIDCHSHTAISKGVNEGSHAVTSEVRIGDVLDATDISLYRETRRRRDLRTHSAWVGQPNGRPESGDQVPLGIVAGRPEIRGRSGGFKFALGENVKQSNWGDKYITRYPQTRMGVRTFHARPFPGRAGI